MTKGPKGGKDIYRERRRKLSEQIKDGVMILAAHPEQVRNNDVHQKYRQDSSFYYLSGFSEPDSVLVINPSSTTPFVMFVREKDPTRELWDGFRYGIEGTAEYFGADKVYAIRELRDKLPELLKFADKIYYKSWENKKFDQVVYDSMEEARRSRGRSGLGVPTIADAKQVVGEMRLKKSAEETEWLRKASEIAANAHIAAMKFCKPGLWEYEIEALVEYEFRRQGSERLGYNSIVGRGPNATVLHYIFNDDKCMDGDLVLIDAGTEYNYLTSDITRTFPVNGKYTEPQRRLYETILRVQKSCIDISKPGIRFSEIHQHAISGLVDGMIDLGLLRGAKNKIMESKEYLKYFPHGTGHWLGMDVHDSGLYQLNGESRKLEAGMCFTIEPGLYVPLNDTSAPQEFRGLGIRIEDDVIINASGCEVLTKLAPKEVDEIEALVGTA